MGRTGNAAKGIPRAVIFDFDGVILESANIKSEAFVDLFADHTVHRDAILAHHIENLGVSRYRKFEWIYRELLCQPLDEEESRRLGESFSTIVLDRILACPFVPGALELLESLAPLTSLFVASGTPQEELDHIVDRRGLRRYFREVWGTPQSKVEIIESILSRFQIDSSEAVFLGDGISDYRAARQTNVPFIARQTAQVDVDWNALAALVIPDLTEAKALLGLQSSDSQT